MNILAEFLEGGRGREEFQEPTIPTPIWEQFGRCPALVVIRTCEVAIFHFQKLSFTLVICGFLRSLSIEQNIITQTGSHWAKMSSVLSPSSLASFANFYNFSIIFRCCIPVLDVFILSFPNWFFSAGKMTESFCPWLPATAWRFWLSAATLVYNQLLLQLLQPIVRGQDRACAGDGVTCSNIS